MSPLGPDDVQLLLRRASGRGHTGTRNRALVAAFAGVGLGVSEALALRASDLELERGVVSVPGPRARSVAVPASVMGALAAWAADRERLGIAPGPLFCTRDGLPLEASYVRRLIARVGRAAGLEVPPLNARTLRESYAAGRLASGASIEALSADLGHATIASTQRFVRRFEGTPMPDLPGLHLLPDVAEALLGLSHAGLAVLRARRDAHGTIDDFVVEYVNPVAAGVMGRPPDDLVGTSVRDTFPNSPTDGTYARWTALIDGHPEGQDPRLFESEGQTRSYRVRRMAVGERVVMSFEDQSAVRQVRQALGQVESRHAALLEASPTGVVMTDPEGVVVLANAAAHTVLGIPMGGLHGRALLDPRWGTSMPDGSRLQTAQRPTILTQTTGQPVRGLEVEIARSDGYAARLSVNTQAIEGGGPPYGVVVTVLDLEPVRTMEGRARAAEEAVALMHLLRASALVRCRTDGTVTAAGGETRALLGAAPADVVGEHWQQGVRPGDRTDVREAGVRAMETHETVSVRHHTPHGLRVLRHIRAVRDPVTTEIQEVQSLVVRDDQAGGDSRDTPAIR